MSLLYPGFSTDTRNSSFGYHTKVEAAQFSYFWTIDDFKISHKDYQKYVSSPFNVETSNLVTEWCLELYPIGEQQKDEGYLNVVLNLLDPTDVELVLNFTFSIVNAKGKQTNIKKWNDIKFFGIGDLGFVRFMKLGDLMSRESDLLPNDKLTICCDLMIINPTKIKKSEENNGVDLKCESRVCYDLLSLLESKMHSDVTFLVHDKKFSAHNVILAARSPFFEAMFQSDMQENNDNTVKITDVKVEAFESVLMYIYSGKTPNLMNSKQIENVLYVASKYALDHLVKMCEIALWKNLSVENAAEILATADLHDTNILRGSAKEFIIINAKEVIETQGWHLLEMRYPHIAIQILRAIIKSNNANPT